MFASLRHFVGFHRILLSRLGAVILFLLAKPTLLTSMLGITGILAGLGIRTWSKGFLMKNQELAQSGPYALVRNPLYLGNFLIGFGFAVMAGKLSLLAFFLIAWAMVYYSTIQEEETLLQKQFGKNYEAYTRRVPRMIPWRFYQADFGQVLQWGDIKTRKEGETWAAVSVLVALMALQPLLFAKVSALLS